VDTVSAHTGAPSTAFDLTLNTVFVVNRDWKGCVLTGAAASCINLSATVAGNALINTWAGTGQTGVVTLIAHIAGGAAVLTSLITWLTDIVVVEVVVPVTVDQTLPMSMPVVNVPISRAEHVIGVREHIAWVHGGHVVLGPLEVIHLSFKRVSTSKAYSNLVIRVIYRNAWDRLRMQLSSVLEEHYIRPGAMSLPRVPNLHPALVDLIGVSSGIGDVEHVSIEDVDFRGVAFSHEEEDATVIDVLLLPVEGGVAVAWWVWILVEVPALEHPSVVNVDHTSLVELHPGLVREHFCVDEVVDFDA
jgi:hypothetical protein